MKWSRKPTTSRTTIRPNTRSSCLAAWTANTLADAFIAQQMDRMVEATRYATQFLAKQLEESRVKLGEAETHLSNYLNEKGILFVTDRFGQQQDIITQQLTIMSEA